MSEVAALGFAVNTGDIKRASDDLNTFTVVGGKAEKSAESLEDAAKRLGVTVEEMRRRVSAAGETLLIGGKSADTLSGSLTDVEEATSQANEELAKAVQLNNSYAGSVKAANDNNAVASGGFKSMVSEILAAATHLKLVAVAAYALVPALRPIFNSAILGGLSAVRSAIGAVGTASTVAGTSLAKASFEAELAGTKYARFAPAATAVANGFLATGTALSSATGAAGGMVGVLGSLLTFAGRIAGPLLILVSLWKGLVALISQGADLVEKYGKESRSLDDSGMAANLEKLGKLQQDSIHVSASQGKWAGDISRQLDDANFRIKQFFETQINLNSVGLFFQQIWATIVTSLANALDLMMKIALAVPNAVRAAMDNPAVRAGARAVLALRQELGLSLPDGSDEPSVAAQRSQMQREAQQRELQVARERAQQRISAQLGSKLGTGADDHDESIGSTFTARFNMAIKLLAEGEQKAKEETDELADAFDRAYLAAKKQAAGVQADVEAVGMSVGAHAQLKMQYQLMEVAMQSVKDASDVELTDAEAKAAALKKYGDKIAQVSRLYGDYTLALHLAKAQSDATFAGQTMLFSDSEKQIASILRTIYGDQWQNMMKSPLADTLRWNNVLKDVVDTSREIGKTILSSVVGALMSGKNVMDELSSALKSLSMRLADKAIESLLSGDFMKAAVSGISAAVTFIGSKLTDTSQQKALDAAKKKFADMTDQVNNFVSAASGFDLSQFVSAMQSIAKATLDMVQTAVAAGDTAKAIQIIFAAVRQINNQVDQFIKPRGDTAGEKVAAVQNEAQQIIGELNDLNAQYHVGINRTADILKSAADKVKAIQDEVTATIQSDINSASGKGFINDIQSLIDKMKQFKDEQGVTGVDTSLIDRWFVVQAQKVVDGASLVGDSFSDLVKMFPQLNGQIHESTAALDAQAAAQKQLQDSVNSTAKNIVDFRNGLLSGSSSTLAPGAIYSNARAAFNANLPLAQGGNLDAQNKFIELANNLLASSRTVNASSQAFQDDLQMVLSTSGALPAVQQSTDPVVVSLNAVLSAIQANGSTQALDATMQGVVKSAIDAGNAKAIAALMAPKFNMLNTTSALGLTFTDFVAGLGPSYANLVKDPTTAALLTDAQLRASTLGVTGPLTKSQIQALGLSTEQGNLLNVFRELDGDGNGILEKSEAIRAATVGTQNNTLLGTDGSIGHEIQFQSTQHGAIEGSTAAINNSATRIVNAINGLGALTAGFATDHSKKLADIAQYSLLSLLHSGGSGSGGSGSSFSWLGFASGGVAPPGMGVVYAEHSPGGPRFGRFSEPIAVTPNAPWSGASLVPLVHELISEVRRLGGVVAAGSGQVTKAVIAKGDEHIAVTEDSGRRVAHAVTHKARDNKDAA